MSCGQVKNSLIVYFSLTRTSYLVTGQVKILMYLPWGQVKIFRFFYPCIEIDLMRNIFSTTFISFKQLVWLALLVDKVNYYPVSFLSGALIENLTFYWL